MRTFPPTPKDVEFALEHEIATGAALTPDAFPDLCNLSASFFFDAVPIPERELRPEFAFVPFDPSKSRDAEEHVELFMAEWNSLWEAGHLRPLFRFLGRPQRLAWLDKIGTTTNVYLLPDPGGLRYQAYAPIFHLLPAGTLTRFGLPLLKGGFWPPTMHNHWRHILLPDDFEERLGSAFAHQVWPFLESGSLKRAFSDSNPLVLLSHNLDYWMPFAYRVVQDRIRAFGRCEVDSAAQDRKLNKLRKHLPEGVSAERPSQGGWAWRGEQDALEALNEIVNAADADGRLRSIIDSVRSNSVEEDFSNCWSYAREDFERKLYQKRAKIKITFVELDETAPVHGPFSEFTEDLLWEDFISILDRKERRVIVCLRNGTTTVGDISKDLGYANHSPVSKTLAKIREKATILG